MNVVHAVAKLWDFDRSGQWRTNLGGIRRHDLERTKTFDLISLDQAAPMQ